ncbi:hypothetical protein V6N13_024792 [Hibiscus sabdariffa]|uniref:Uncharacterized protein n=2 Tax=Hibiscus sabdariffa TaxID=183260 RepID=A0ABR2BUJ7_9ROSI
MKHDNDGVKIRLRMAQTRQTGSKNDGINSKRLTLNKIDEEDSWRLGFAPNGTRLTGGDTVQCMVGERVIIRGGPVRLRKGLSLREIWDMEWL